MFRNYLFRTACLTALVFTGACGGDGDPASDPDPTPSVPPTYTLSADRTTVRINEDVTFTVLSSDGEDVTSAWNICDDSGCRAGNVFAWEMPGTYTVTAHSKTGNLEAENSLTVVVRGTVYTLKADSEVVRVGDPVRFTVTALKNGTDESDATSSFVVGVRDGERYSGHTHIFYEKGVYTIEAVMRSDESVRALNTVDIIVKERTTTGHTDRFYRRSLVAEGTGTSCWSCPATAAGIEHVMKNLLYDRMVPVAFHEAGDAVGVAAPVSGYFMAFFSDYGLHAYPYYVVDWNDAYKSDAAMHNVDTAGAEMAHAIEASQARYESTPGLAVATTLAGRDLSVAVRVTAREQAGYYLGVLLVEDGIETEQTGAADNRMVQMNVVQLRLTSSLAESLGALAENAERSFSYTAAIPERHVLANCRVVVYLCKADAAVRPYGYFCANVVSVVAGGSVDYQYEPAE